MRKSTKLKIFRRKKRSVILSVLKRHSLRQHTAVFLPGYKRNKTGYNRYRYLETDMTETGKRT